MLTLGKSAALPAACRPWPPAGLPLASGTTKTGRAAWLYPHISPGSPARPPWAGQRDEGRPLQAAGFLVPPATRGASRGLPRNGSEQRDKQPVPVRGHSSPTDLRGALKQDTSQGREASGPAQDTGNGPLPTPLPFTRETLLPAPPSFPLLPPLTLPTAGTHLACPLRPLSCTQAG